MPTHLDGGLAFLSGLVQAFDNAVAGVDGGQRANVGLLVIPRANGHLADALFQAGDNFVVEGFHDDQALRSVARLASVVHADLHEVVQDVVEVVVVKNDEWVVTAQFEQRLLVVLASGLGDGCTGRFGTGERYALNALVGDEGVHLRTGGVHVDEHALGQAGLFEQVLACLGG